MVLYLILDSCIYEQIVKLVNDIYLQVKDRYCFANAEAPSLQHILIV